jgi:hypothetical protein
LEKYFELLLCGVTGRFPPQIFLPPANKLEVPFKFNHNIMSTTMKLFLLEKTKEAK